MCATSIGFTFSHSPVPGLRKSGIPDGTDTPAPVSATARSESRMSSASAVACGDRTPAGVTNGWSRRRACPPSLALEARLALAEEGRDPLPGVVGAERGGEPAGLPLEAGVELGVGRDILDLLHRDRSLPGQLARPRERGVEQLVVRDDLVDQSQPLGLPGRYRLSD